MVYASHANGTIAMAEKNITWNSGGRRIRGRPRRTRYEGIRNAMSEGIVKRRML